MSFDLKSSVSRIVPLPSSISLALNHPPKVTSKANKVMIIVKIPKQTFKSILVFCGFKWSKP